MMEGRLMAVEFRNKSWWTDRTRESTLAFEREHALVNVVVDGRSVLSGLGATSPELAIMRMHARNTESWEKKGLTAIVRTV